MAWVWIEKENTEKGFSHLRIPLFLFFLPPFLPFFEFVLLSSDVIEDWKYPHSILTARREGGTAWHRAVGCRIFSCLSLICGKAVWDFPENHSLYTHTKYPVLFVVLFQHDCLWSPLPPFIPKSFYYYIPTSCKIWLIFHLNILAIPYPLPDITLKHLESLLNQVLISQISFLSKWLMFWLTADQ